MHAKTAFVTLVAKLSETVLQACTISFSVALVLSKQQVMLQSCQFNKVCMHVQIALVPLVA